MLTGVTTPPLSGPGLFTGKPATITIAPVAPATGITFHTPSIPDPCPALARSVTADTSWSGLPGVPIRNTTITHTHPFFFCTIEHVMSALAGLNIWHARITLTDPAPSTTARAIEVPILDGSAEPFTRALKHLQHVPSPAHSPITLASPIEVHDERAGAHIAAFPLAPRETPSYTYSLDYGNKSPIRAHTATWVLDDSAAETYEKNIAPARTFSLESEALAAQRAGLFRHLTPRDMLVIGNDGNPIDNAWRFPDEPARHKLLDRIGDLALLGAPLHARVVAHKAGHALTHAFCRAVMARLQPPAETTPGRLA